ncbi:hypothetical protein TNCV_1624401 [Trichonephila clavipes]|nr:hypothetical protein TNCV_1624401 [Trichonephila clavipes]
MLTPSCGQLYYPSWNVIRTPVSNKIIPGPIPLAYLWTVNALPWPGRSPDLSPIKHVRDMEGRQIRAPENIADLEKQQR